MIKLNQGVKNIVVQFSTVQRLKPETSASLPAGRQTPFDASGDKLAGSRGRQANPTTH